MGRFEVQLLSAIQGFCLLEGHAGVLEQLDRLVRRIGQA